MLDSTLIINQYDWPTTMTIAVHSYMNQSAVTFKTVLQCNLTQMTYVTPVSNNELPQISVYISCSNSRIINLICITNPRPGLCQERRLAQLAPDQ